jgi:cystathionine beta-synthase
MISNPNILNLIGNTPLVELQTFDTGPCRLFVNLESQNPGGSIKDRIGRSMIETAEREGRIAPGSTLVEATAGNTGLGLALVAAQKGYRLILVIPDKMSQEKVLHLKGLGAEVVMTRSDVGRGHPQYYQDMAEEIAKRTPNAFYVNQFNNPANPLAHETTTGPEIWAQTNHNVDAVVCGVGSGGTITGLSRFFARVAPQVEMVLADPAGSVLADYVQTGRIGQAGSWAVEGIGEDFAPPIADLSRVRSAYTRMRLYDVSQLPVLEGSKIIGILDESDLLLAVMADASVFQQPVRAFMASRLQTVSPRAGIEELLPIFDVGHVAIVVDGEEFCGLITRVDVVSHLRRRAAA